jgi:UbiA prenyltransferase family
MSRFKSARALLVLGRVSNLPTVWSNCVAGWWLGGAQNQQRLAWVLAGGTLVYTGGMFLNDAFDVEFDRKYRQDRPIPSGAISRCAVWMWGIGLVASGAAAFFGAGLIAGVIGLVLSGCVVAYDAAHKKIEYGPLLMGGCRFWLYLAAGASAANGVSGRMLCGAGAMFCYIVGLSYIARRESTSGGVGFWPLAPLLLPIALAMMREMPASFETLKPILLVSAVVALWVGKCVRFTLNFPDRNVGRAVGGLLAGICLVDWLAVANAPKQFAVVFIGLFLLALGLQRWVPAT